MLHFSLSLPSSGEIKERLKAKEEKEKEEEAKRQKAEEAKQGSEVTEPSADGADAPQQQQQQDKAASGTGQEPSGEPTSGKTCSTAPHIWMIFIEQPAQTHGIQGFLSRSCSY